jgi:Leucine-rich repeat (LRR) protein
MTRRIIAMMSGAAAILAITLAPGTAFADAPQPAASDSSVPASTPCEEGTSSWVDCFRDPNFAQAVMEGARNGVGSAQQDKECQEVKVSETGIGEPVPHGALKCVTNIDANGYGMLGKSITGLQGISRLPNLSYLNLSSNNVSDISELSSLKKLNYLDLTNDPVTDLSPLSEMTTLEKLHAESQYITNFDFLKKLINLKELYLTGGDSSDDYSCTTIRGQLTDLSWLTKMTNLDNLNLSCNSITNLVPLVTLANSVQDETSISEDSHPGLQLTELNLSNNKISTVPKLTNLRNLTTLDLSNNEVSDVSGIAPVLNGCQSLSLSGNQISDLSVFAKKLSSLAAVPDSSCTEVDIDAENQTVTLPNTTIVSGTDLALKAARGANGKAAKLTKKSKSAGAALKQGKYVWESVTDSGQYSAAWKQKMGTSEDDEPQIFSGTMTSDVTVVPVDSVGCAVGRSYNDCFPDVNLARAVAKTVAPELDEKSTVTAGALENITKLDARNKEIKDLTGIDTLTNARMLMLGGNKIACPDPESPQTDEPSCLTPLRDMTQIRALGLASGNFTTLDMAPIRTLTSLRSLNISNNKISSLAWLRPLRKIAVGKLHAEGQQVTLPEAKLSAGETMRENASIIARNGKPVRELIFAGPDSGSLPTYDSESGTISWTPDTDGGITAVWSQATYVGSRKIGIFGGALKQKVTVTPAVDEGTGSDPDAGNHDSDAGNTTNNGGSSTNTNNDGSNSGSNPSPSGDVTSPTTNGESGGAGVSGGASDNSGNASIASQGDGAGTVTGGGLLKDNDSQGDSLSDGSSDNDVVRLPSTAAQPTSHASEQAGTTTLMPLTPALAVTGSSIRIILVVAAALVIFGLTLAIVAARPRKSHDAGKIDQ